MRQWAFDWMTYRCLRSFYYTGTSHCRVQLKALSCSEGHTHTHAPTHATVTDRHADAHTHTRFFRWAIRRYRNNSQIPLTIFRCMFRAVRVGCFGRNFPPYMRMHVLCSQSNLRAHAYCALLISQIPARKTTPTPAREGKSLVWESLNLRMHVWCAKLVEVVGETEEVVGQWDRSGTQGMTE